MSNDLISRKTAYKAFSDYLNRNFIGEISFQTELSIGEIASVIKSIPTAFDKERVIEGLDECRKLMLSPVSEDCFGESCKENDCMACVFNKAIEIVEKGGLN